MGLMAHFAVSPLDQEEVDSAARAGQTRVHLKHVPRGLWARMEKYTGAPFSDTLEGHDDSPTQDLTGTLAFIEPRTSEPVHFRGSKVTRTGFPFSLGRAITTTARQGRTTRKAIGREISAPGRPAVRHHCCMSRSKGVFAETALDSSFAGPGPTIWPD